MILASSQRHQYPPFYETKRRVVGLGGYTVFSATLSHNVDSPPQRHLQPGYTRNISYEKKNSIPVEISDIELPE